MESSEPSAEAWVVERLLAARSPNEAPGSNLFDYPTRPVYWGPRENPYGVPVVGLYRSQPEALAAAAIFKSRGTRDEILTPPRMYDEPCAWLVTFIIVMQQTGEAKLHVEPHVGGEITSNDDRDVMAIFPTRAEAEAWAAVH